MTHSSEAGFVKVCFMDGGTEDLPGTERAMRSKFIARYIGEDTNPWHIGYWMAEMSLFYGKDYEQIKRGEV